MWRLAIAAAGVAVASTWLVLGVASASRRLPATRVVSHRASGQAGKAHRSSRPAPGSNCPHPSIRVPPNEPVYRDGPTELVTGIYVQGGPVPPPPCKPEPRGPYAGTITVTNASTGATVATQSVANGHLAHIPLAPGRYQVSGQITGGGSTNYNPTVRIRRGLKVRQDVFEDVP